jgi:hypothetical protein
MLLVLAVQRVWLAIKAGYPLLLIYRLPASPRWLMRRQH